MENETTLTQQQAAMMGADDDWYEITLKGLVVQRDPTWNEWEKFGMVLAVYEHSLAKLIGDWANIGEERFGEKVTQVEDIFGEKSYGHVANCKSVMGRVLYDRRVGNLSFSHLRVVAPLDPDDQIKYQRMAVDQELTSSELNEIVNPPEPPKFKELVEPIKDSIDRVFEREDDIVGGISEKERLHLDNARAHILEALKARSVTIDREFHDRLSGEGE